MAENYSLTLHSKYFEIRMEILLRPSVHPNSESFLSLNLIMIDLQHEVVYKSVLRRYAEGMTFSAFLQREKH